jgi:hypothetical protein
MYLRQVPASLQETVIANAKKAATEVAACVSSNRLNHILRCGRPGWFCSGAFEL